jgi:hypothetical protein
VVKIPFIVKVFAANVAVYAVVAHLSKHVTVMVLAMVQLFKVVLTILIYNILIKEFKLLLNMS